MDKVYFSHYFKNDFHIYQLNNNLYELISQSYYGGMVENYIPTGKKTLDIIMMLILYILN
jgi:hypothetical protein